jgi:uncharacterized membrane protein YeaQ/YmgE (transglycosylase-associated protein family)
MNLDQDTQNLLWFLGIGLAAGFLAGRNMKGRGFGVIGNLVVGVVGALLGGYLFAILGIEVGGGLGGQLLTALAGALVLVIITGFVKRTDKR